MPCYSPFDYLLDPLLSSLIFLSFQVWDIPNKRIRNIFSGHKSRVESVDFSPNGRLVVSASWDMTVRIWNMRDGSESLLTDYALIFTSVKFSPNGQFIGAGNSDGFLRIWHVRSGRLERRWTGHKSIVWSVAFMPDGNGLVSGGLDGVVKCWNVGFVQQFRGDPVSTKVLDSKGSTVCIVFSWIFFFLSHDEFFCARMEPIPLLFLLMLDGSPSVYPMEWLFGMLTGPYHSVH